MVIYVRSCALPDPEPYQPKCPPDSYCHFVTALFTCHWWSPRQPLILATRYSIQYIVAQPKRHIPLMLRYPPTIHQILYFYSISGLQEDSGAIIWGQTRGLLIFKIGSKQKLKGYFVISSLFDMWSSKMKMIHLHGSSLGVTPCTLHVSNFHVSWRNWTELP